VSLPSGPAADPNPSFSRRTDWRELHHFCASLAPPMTHATGVLTLASAAAIRQPNSPACRATAPAGGYCTLRSFHAAPTPPSNDDPSKQRAQVVGWGLSVLSAAGAALWAAELEGAGGRGPPSKLYLGASCPLLST